MENNHLIKNVAILFHLIFVCCTFIYIESFAQQHDYWNRLCGVNYCMYRVFHSQSATCVLPVWIPAHEEHIKSVSLRVSFWSGCCLWRLPVCTAESEIPHRNRVYVFENKSLVDNSLTFTSVSQQMLTTVSGGFYWNRMVNSTSVCFASANLLAWSCILSWIW